MSEVVQYYLEIDKKANKYKTKPKFNNEDLNLLSIEKFPVIITEDNKKQTTISSNLQELKDKMKTEENKDTF